jgi:hypothetical protein
VIASASHKDNEAAWSKHRRRRAVFGFKARVGADAEPALVDEVAVTPGNVNDGRAGSQALPDDPGDVYADSAYRGQVFGSARESGQNDLFRARLDQIIDIGHPLAKLAGAIDWRFLEDRFGAVYSDKAGHPPLPTRLMAGLAILKSMHDLSDEELCARWVDNPYFQLFGEEFFRHKTPFDRSSLTRWRQRMGEEKLVALIQESLATTTRTGAVKPSDFSRVIVDTTVQPKAVAFPTNAKLMHPGARAAGEAFPCASPMSGSASMRWCGVRGRDAHF